MNDAELVRGLRCREPAAMQWLCDCYLPSLWRFVYTRVNGDSHLAEDITNETILAMLTSLQSGGADTAEIVNPGGWLRTVAGRRITDHFRAVARVRGVLEVVAGVQPERDEADPSRQHELLELRIEVRQVMDGMPEQYRLALEWKYLDGLSVREIAVRWEMTEKAAESVLFRARREFRDRLARTEDMANQRHARGTLSPSRSESAANGTPEHDASTPDAKSDADAGDTDGEPAMTPSEGNTSAKS